MALVTDDRRRAPSPAVMRERGRVRTADVAMAGMGALITLAGLKGSRRPHWMAAVVGLGISGLGLARLTGAHRLLTGSPHESDIADERNWSSAAVVTRSITIGKPRDEVYRYWRNLPNLARASDDVVRVELLEAEGRRSRWVIKAPGGARIFLLARITDEQHGRLIAWDCDRNSTIRHFGRIEFKDAPSNRGTEVHMTLAYEPPMGRLGQLAAKIMRREPGVQARDALRRLKQLMEVGEITTSNVA